MNSRISESIYLQIRYPFNRQISYQINSLISSQIEYFLEKFILIKFEQRILDLIDDPIRNQTYYQLR